MPLEVIATALFLVVFIAGVVRQVLRRTPRGSGPMPDVPDASPTAARIDAPGVRFPYSSVDPSAPPKRFGDETSEHEPPHDQV